MNPVDRTIAYFSMEIALESSMPSYSGGLGALAGDTIRSAADLKVPMVAVCLLYRKGYFFQSLDDDGTQKETPAEWVVENFLSKTLGQTSVKIEGRDVRIEAWRYDAISRNGFIIPVFFLDTDIEGNAEEDRKLSFQLYGGDSKYRLCQEIVLGIGGVKMLRALGYKDINTFHMNEGHASLLTLELLDESRIKEGRATIGQEDVEKVRKMCVFTTHTPVPAGHDQFPLSMVEQVLDNQSIVELKNLFCHDGNLNMTYIALNLSDYVNGVAKKHGEISRLMFASHSIDAITNGVYAPYWVSHPFQTIFDKYIPNWREDNFAFRAALSIPPEEIWEAHLKAKKQLFDYITQETNTALDLYTLTIGFGRRAASYKRADLLFHDIERLKEIVQKCGKLQIIYAGKAHPKDLDGKSLIKRIFHAIKELKDEIKIIYLENYDMKLAKLMTAGTDVWLNTPRPPMEASGTSGMKAALNGVPSLSVLDGWWIEGCIEGITGWSIGYSPDKYSFDADQKEFSSIDEEDAKSLYDKLEGLVFPLYYENREEFIRIMKSSIALNGSFFNTHRMVQQYMLNAYLRFKAAGRSR